MKILKVIGKIIAVIFCIVYFFILTGIMLLTFTRSLSSGSYYATVLENIDLNSIKVSDLGELINIDGINADDSLEDVLVAVLEEGGVEKKTATKIIQNKEIRDIIGNFIGDYINFTLGGDKPSISRADVKKVLNNPDVISVTGKPTEENIDYVYNQLQNMIKEIIEGGGAKNGNYKQPVSVDIIR